MKIAPLDDVSAYKALMEWATVLSNVEESKFDMTHFASPCGTKACIAGWATAVPIIADRGWKLGHNSDAKPSPYTVFTQKGEGAYAPDAAHSLFIRVTVMEWDKLFYDSFATKSFAVRSLQNFAERYK